MRTNGLFNYKLMEKNKVLGLFKHEDLDKAVLFAEEMRHKYYKEYAGKT